MPSPIKTYDPQRYTDRFIETGDSFSAHVKPEFERFFAVRIEDMIRLMKLPVPPARTTNHTLMYLTEGEATMTIGSEEHTVYANDCLFVPAGQVFAIGNVDVDSAKGFLCNMDDDFIVGQFAGRELLKRYDFLQVWGTPRVALDAETSGFVRQLAERILKLLADGAPTARVGRGASSLATIRSPRDTSISSSRVSVIASCSCARGSARS